MNEYRNISINIGKIPDSMWAAIERAKITEEHDINFSVWPEMHKFPCDTCDRRERGYFDELKGRWGSE